MSQPTHVNHFPVKAMDVNYVPVTNKQLISAVIAVHSQQSQELELNKYWPSQEGKEEVEIKN